MRLRGRTALWAEMWGVLCGSELSFEEFSESRVEVME